VTIVSAPAGYGKSTAVLEWLDSKQLQSAWVSLDIKDNTLTYSGSNIGSALGGIDERISSDTEYVFSSPELFKTNIHLILYYDRLDESRF
jgi:LuxR family maltose regulon positive regulatory protein